MKLTSDTLSVLKNFSNINSGILLRKGKSVRTISSLGTVMAHATISDEMTSEFCIYDLTKFLSVLSLHKDNVDLDFDSKDIIITGQGGRSRIKYRACDPTMIVAAPDKSLNLPSVDISFSLTAEEFRWIMDAANVLSSPQIAIVSDGSDVYIKTLDVKDDSAHTESYKLNINTSDTFNFILKTENMSKLFNGAYDVSISSQGISHFKCTTTPVEYWIALETGSTFTKG